LKSILNQPAITKNFVFFKRYDFHFVKIQLDEDNDTLMALEGDFDSATNTSIVVYHNRKWSIADLSYQI